MFDVYGGDSPYRVSACSATAPYAEVPARYRPAGLPPPTADPALLRQAGAMTDIWPSRLVIGGIAAGLAAVAVGALATWARRRTQAGP